VHDEDGKALTIFAVNRSLTEDMDLEADVYGFENNKKVEHTVLCNPDLKAVNSAAGEKVKPAPQNGGSFDGKNLTVRLPKASWNLIRIVP
jgi:alpha-N-arabinofuranosidase